MNKTYEDVISLQETLWCIDVLDFIVWMSQHNYVFCNRYIYRALLTRFVYKNLEFTDDSRSEFAVVYKRSGDSSEKKDAEHTDLRHLMQKMNSIGNTVEKLSKAADFMYKKTRAEMDSQSAEGAGFKPTNDAGDYSSDARAACHPPPAKINKN